MAHPSPQLFDGKRAVGRELADVGDVRAPDACSTGVQFANSLADPNVGKVLILKDLTLLDADWANLPTPVAVDRNVLVEGAKPNRSEWVTLDLNYVKSKLRLGFGVTLTFTSVVLARWREDPHFAAPGLDIIAPFPPPKDGTWPAVIGENVSYIQRTCVPLQLQRNSASGVPRPTQFPGTQITAGNTSQAGCVNSTTANPNLRCWPMVGWYQDLATYAANYLTNVSSTAAQVGYLLLIKRSSYFCETLMTLECASNYQPVGCFFTMFPKNNAMSPPAAAGPVVDSGSSRPPSPPRLGYILGGTMGGLALIGAVVGLMVLVQVAMNRRRRRRQCSQTAAAAMCVIDCTAGSENGSVKGGGCHGGGGGGGGAAADRRCGGADTLDWEGHCQGGGGKAGEHGGSVSNAPLPADASSGVSTGNAPTSGSQLLSTFPGAVSVAYLAANSSSACMRPHLPVTPLTPVQPGIHLDIQIDGPELRLSGETLGKGAFGRVVRGTFRGVKVAVKVIDHGLGPALHPAAAASRAAEPPAPLPLPPPLRPPPALPAGPQAAAAAAGDERTSPVPERGVVVDRTAAAAADHAGPKAPPELQAATSSVEGSAVVQNPSDSGYDTAAEEPTVVSADAASASVAAAAADEAADEAAEAVAAADEAAEAAEAAAAAVVDEAFWTTAAAAAAPDIEPNSYTLIGSEADRAAHCTTMTAPLTGSNDAESEGNYPSSEQPRSPPLPLPPPPPLLPLPPVEAQAAAAVSVGAAAEEPVMAGPVDDGQESLSLNSALNATLKQEVEVLARCRHPNIVRLLAACLKPPRLCLVMELMETSLDRLLYGGSGKRRQEMVLPLNTVLHIALQIACGLAYLHPTIVHRDLKPGNVLISQAQSSQPVVKLADFGLSRLRDTVLITRQPEVGTAPYIAPEAFDVSNNCITDRVDVYALGVLLWEMLAGRRPWAGHNMVVIALAVSMHNKRPPLEALSAERCPAKLKSLMMSCWEQDPARRPAAADVAKTLTLIQQQQLQATSQLAAGSSNDGNSGTTQLVTAQSTQSFTVPSAGYQLWRQESEDQQQAPRPPPREQQQQQQQQQVEQRQQQQQQQQQQVEQRQQEQQQQQQRPVSRALQHHVHPPAGFVALGPLEEAALIWGQLQRTEANDDNRVDGMGADPSIWGAR